MNIYDWPVMDGLRGLLIYCECSMSVYYCGIWVGIRGRIYTCLTSDNRIQRSLWSIVSFGLLQICTRFEEISQLTLCTHSRPMLCFWIDWGTVSSVSLAVFWKSELYVNLDNLRFHVLDKQRVYAPRILQNPLLTSVKLQLKRTTHIQ